MAAASGLTCRLCTLVPESTLSHRLQAHHGLVPKLSHHKWQKHRPSDSKTHTAQENMFFSVAQRNDVFASEGVFMLQSNLWNVKACARACSKAQRRDITTKARRAKHIKEGFLRFLLNSEAN